MEVRLDFTLSKNLGVVEKTIFRMVLRGITSSIAIAELLWIFSDSVKAAATQKLVNAQLIHVDLFAKELSLSDGIVALISACHNKTYSLDLPDILSSRMKGGVLILDDCTLISDILNFTLPGVDLGHLVPYLSFIITNTEV